MLLHSGHRSDARRTMSKPVRWSGGGKVPGFSQTGRAGAGLRRPQLATPGSWSWRFQPECRGSPRYLRGKYPGGNRRFGLGLEICGLQGL